MLDNLSRGDGAQSSGNPRKLGTRGQNDGEEMKREKGKVREVRGRGDWRMKRRDEPKVKTQDIYRICP